MIDLIRDIEEWLQLQLKISNKSGFILGVSGGLDSSVLFCILNKANINFKAYHIITDNNEMKQSEIVALKFLDDISKSKIINLSAQNLHSEFFSVIVSDKYNFNDSIYSDLNAVVNARIRENIFYANAKLYNYLVLGSVNKVEFMTGYFVKNCSIGDLLPFAEVDKSKIRSMGTLLGLPELVVNAKASGCNNKEFAEDELFIPETILDRLVNNKNYSSECEQYEKLYNNYLNVSKHKRIYPPIFNPKNV